MMQLEGKSTIVTGGPEEVAGAALFLSSPDAAYVSGHALNVDGGFNAAGLLLDL